MKYKPVIDGLRAIAVLPVVVFHACPQYAPGGFIGVDVFFVISGFLISGLIFEGVANESFSLRSFYAGRIRRIFPALLAVLIAVFIAGWWLLFPIEMISLGQQMAASAAFAANIYFWSQAGYFEPDANTYPLLHLWSLGVEEQFYIVWPIMVMVLWRWPRAIPFVMLVVGASSFVFMLLAVDRAAAFYLPTSRAWELMVGAGLAWCARKIDGPSEPVLFDAAAIIGLVLIFCSIFFIRQSDPYPGWRALGPTIGAGLVLWGATGSRVIEPVLSWRPLVFVGLISYPLYMWHWPVFWTARTIATADLSLVWVLVSFSISFVLAWITFQFIEKPIRYGADFSPKLSPNWLVTSLVVVACAGLISARNGFPGRWPSEIITLLSYKFDDRIFRIGKCHLKPEQGPSDFSGECFSNRTPGARHVVLWGDSAVTAIEPGLQFVGKGRFDIDELTTSNCPPFIGDYKPMADRPHCSAINRYALQYIRTSKPDIVILSFSPSYETDLPKQAKNTVDQLRTFFAGTLVVVGPPPLWPKAFPEILLQTYMASPSRGMQKSISMPAEVAQASETLDSTLGSAITGSAPGGGTEVAGTIYVSAFQQLCPSEKCVAMVEGEPSTFDRFHITKGASAIVARAIYAAIGG
jgi:peptidoglycan/LPS O-acetylase OafA/YrhL